MRRQAGGGILESRWLGGLRVTILGTMRSRVLGNAARCLSGASRSAELAVLRELQLMRTPRGVADALRVSRIGLGPGWVDMTRQLVREAPTLREGIINAGAVAGAMTLSGSRSVLGKLLVARSRPHELAEGITSAARALPRGSSFPSTHAAISSAAAAVLELRGSPALAARARDLASAVSMSRQYLGVHFPSDVAAGEQMGAEAARTVLALLHRA